MRKVLSLLILLALLLTTVAPALAQDGPPPADQDAVWQAYLPFVTSTEDGNLAKPPEEPAPTPPPTPNPPEGEKRGRVTQAEREAAAARAAAKGFDLLKAAEMAVSMEMGGVPHYFSAPNYANSPLPTIAGAVIEVGNPLIERGFATDYAAPQGELGSVFVVVPTPLPTGLVQSFQTFNQVTPGGSPTASQGGIFHAYVLRPVGSNQYKVIFDSGLLSVPAATNAAGEVTTFPVPNIAVQEGDVLGFYGQGIPVDIDTGGDLLAYPAPVQPLMDQTITLGAGDFPLYSQARVYSFGAQVLDLSGENTVITGGIRKFVDGLPGLGPSGANNLGQYIPVAQVDTTTYPGSDYYEIALVQYEEKLHSDLPPTTLRGYVQLATSVTPGNQTLLFNPDGSPILLPGGAQAAGVDKPHYLGPVIIATRDKPVRILFRNLLPTGAGGNLFIPVDTTVMGAGMGPEMGGMAESDPQNPMCGMNPKPMGCYAENRGTLHLHGGITPWISDGTPHQWITPAGENTSYPAGVSVKNVPDMPDPGPGAMTFFYTNQQSARLMFYHDHAWGITRLNVYAGEAAGYLITDATEQKLVNDGLIPADQIPLIIQDKTFVPPMNQLMMQDPTWEWGDHGELWVPHVYSPAQNPGDSSGVNQFGRWAYGPWFWPPTTDIDYGPKANPYYDTNCNPDESWCEPPQIPGVPNVSMGMEAFNDTPLVNGTAYPTLTVDPKAYRFRVLNAANDRFFNLSFYQADPNAPTEVQLNPAEVEAAMEDTTIFPTPMSGTEGPDWIQIGTEGGFLPGPVVIPPQFTTWVTDPTEFNAGNVDQHSLLLGPAERADVIVDFAQFARQTLILYNDAPAAFPARDPRYDYYTGNADLRDTGGAPSTLPGYGPNTRTVMQIKVNDAAPAPAYTETKLPALQAVFAHKPDGSGVFESSQPPIIVGQAPYNSAYGTAFNLNGPLAGLVQIFNTNFTFKTLLGAQLTIDLQPKQIQDEMGEAFEQEYGRMSGFLGLEKPGANAGVQNMILYPYVNPVSEIVDAIELPPGVKLTPIAAANDGTQIWKITHNGVDTHPIHFHLTDVQLINRVGWDGIIRRPDANELGWKDTVRVSPLEDTIIAMRPVLPKTPFGVPDSVRPLNPMMPIGDTAMFNNTDAQGNPITPPITNQVVNFGWEYVWHCHILSHEEMDMMRPLTALAARALPAAPVLSANGTPGSPVNLTWTDGTLVTTDWMTWGDPAAEVGYRIERAAGEGAFAPIGAALANVTSFSDTSTAAGTVYRYRVIAYNAAGESPSTAVTVGLLPPAAPTNLVASLTTGPGASLTWVDNAANEDSYSVERSVNGGAFATVATLGPNTTSYAEAVPANGTYTYRVAAANTAGQSAYSNTASVTVQPGPAAPTNLTAQLQAVLGSPVRVQLTFRDNANNESGFVMERQVNGGAWALLATLPARNNTGNVAYTDSTVSAGATYSYRVYAVRNGSVSGTSNVVSVTVPAAPAAPANFRGTPSLGTILTARIQMQWTDASNNESRFVIQRASNAGFTGNVASYNQGANSTSWLQLLLPRRTTYYYRIRAENAYGVSAWVNMTPFPIVTP